MKTVLSTCYILSLSLLMYFPKMVLGQYARSGVPSFRVLPANEIMPQGWIAAQMKRDFKQGFPSVFDVIQPSLGHQVFGPVKVKNFEIDKNGDTNLKRETWWWGEHEGYWTDAVVRTAFLTKDKALLAKAELLVKNVLDHQETDGYIGIYEQRHRLDQLVDENGELWTQSRMLNALLAYYEFTGKKEVLQAVVRAVDYTMAHYQGNKTVFCQPMPTGGGITHGLMFVETLEWLNRISGEDKYIQFATWLYKDFNSSKTIRDKDLQLVNLLDKNKLFSFHGVHVTEELRVLFWLSALSGDPDYKMAVNNAFYKLQKQTVPSGALVSHENVSGDLGFTDKPYEYCTITELMISLFSAMQKYPQAVLGDKIESLVFNAGQGARSADLSGIAYLSVDDRMQAVNIGTNTRYQYSACHDAAACCNLNATKLMPYYVSNMWMKTHNQRGLVLNCYGPSIVSTTIDHKVVQIEQQTGYPADNKVKLVIKEAAGSAFEILLRKPEWCTEMVVKSHGATVYLEDGFYRLNKIWKKNDQIEIEFRQEVIINKDLKGNAVVQKGPIIYALALKGVTDTVRKFGTTGLITANVLPAEKNNAPNVFEGYRLIVPRNGKFKVLKNRLSDPGYPWDMPFDEISVKFEDQGKVIYKVLEPMGSTLLRKVSFPQMQINH